MSTEPRTKNEEFFELDLEKVGMDAEELKAIPPEEKLSHLGELARKQLKQEQEIEDLEKLLSEKKKEHSLISEVTIPDLMDELGIDEFRLSNGVKVTVNPFYQGKITDPKAHEWLNENGHGDIIKGEIKAAFPKGFDQTLLQKILQVAQSIGLEAAIREEVHHSTLKAWIKEMVQTGEQFPRELFNVYIGKRTKLSLK